LVANCSYDSFGFTGLYFILMLYGTCLAFPSGSQCKVKLLVYLDMVLNMRWALVRMVSLKSGTTVYCTMALLRMHACE